LAAPVESAEAYLCFKYCLKQLVLDRVLDRASAAGDPFPMVVSAG
jgi:hypothetical protein